MKFVILRSTLLFFLSCGLIYAQKSEIVEYIDDYKEIAINKMESHGIPAAITMAQAILESGYGTSRLATKGNNHFGIKCHSTWEGGKIYHDDDKQGECFRKYISPEQSFEDHSLFLVKNRRYAPLFKLGVQDYQGWAYGLKRAGYATNPDYAERLIEIIHKYDLHNLPYRGTSRGFAQTSSSPTGGATPGAFSPNSNSGSGYKYNQRVKVHPNRIKFIFAHNNDTFETLSARYDIPIKDLVEWNDFDYQRKLKKGDVIFLQEKRIRGHKVSHVIKEGETLHSISQRFGIQLAYLKKRNSLSTDEAIAAGETLYLRGYK